MEPETELDAALIDEFDAGVTPPHALQVDDALARRKPPLLNGLSRLNHVRTTPDVPPSPATDSTAPSMLRHYPSLDAIPVPAPSRYEPHQVAAEIQTSYPRVEAWGSSRPEQPSGSSRPELIIADGVPPQSGSGIAPHTYTRSQPPPSEDDPSVERLHQDTVVTRATMQQNDQHGENVETPQLDAVPTAEEMEHQRRQIEAQLRHFQQQADYVARALAGDTPHQREMRRQREIERREREERRLAAVETRIEHMVERELQREARQEQRRQRVAERTHRSSVSPSPERDSPLDGDDDEKEAHVHEIAPLTT